MSYVIQAVLSNPRRPECDQITIPFPIPVDQYDKTIEMLQAIDLGFSVNRDCTVDEVNSRYNVLNTLVGTLVNIDQLDYLAKRLDGFCAGEVSQFQAMAHKLGLSEIKDFINLTYCCQQTTVITDFSDLEQIGKDHTRERMNIMWYVTSIIIPGLIKSALTRRRASCSPPEGYFITLKKSRCALCCAPWQRAFPAG